MSDKFYECTARTSLQLSMQWGDYNIVKKTCDPSNTDYAVQKMIPNANKLWQDIAYFEYDKREKCHSLHFIDDRVFAVESKYERFVNHVKAFQAMLNEMDRMNDYDDIIGYTALNSDKQEE